MSSAINSHSDGENSNNNAKNSGVVHVTMTSDLLCPWCYVGLRNLQQGAALAGGRELQITWKPYLLRPNTPADGIPKTGTPASRVGERLATAGQRSGINFTGLTDRTPNTVLFHAVMGMLQDDAEITHGTVTAFHEAVFHGYFTLGIFPDHAGLAKAAADTKTQQHDVLVEKVLALFKDKDRLASCSKQVIREAAEASMQKSISGVPHFEIVDPGSRHTVLSGGQPAETFAHYLR